MYCAFVDWNVCHRFIVIRSSAEHVTDCALFEIYRQSIHVLLFSRLTAGKIVIWFVCGKVVSNFIMSAINLLINLLAIGFRFL